MSGRWLERVALTLILLAAAGARADENVVVIPEDGGRVIVELNGFGARNAAARRETLQRFRRDLAGIARREPQTLGVNRSLRIHREYSVVFFGAAVEMSRAQLASVRALPYVRAVHRDGRVEALGAPVADATLLSDARHRVNATSLGVRGNGIRVAVIDTGIDYTHPALGGRFGPGAKVAGGYDFANDDADPRDDHGHGTHVAGIIAAESEELIGVAPGVTLYAYKVLGAGGGGSFSDVIAGIEAAADPNGDGDPSDHVDVMNLSLGGAGAADDPQARAVDNAVAAGVVVCVAAGNSGRFASIGSPGVAVRAVTVGSINDQGTTSTFTSRGPSPRDLFFKPDIAAPGERIPSSVLDGKTASFSGTSMSSPHAAGVAALLVELHPDWSADEVKAAMISSASVLPGSPHARGAGRVDAARASAASTFLSESGFSFGLDATDEQQWTSTRSITITNRGGSSKTYRFSNDKLPAGLSIAYTPASASIAAGQSQRFEVRLTANNADMAVTDEVTRFGSLTLTAGEETFRVPWLMIRAARLTVAMREPDALTSFPMAYTGTRPTELLHVYAPTRAEAFVPPRLTWEIFFIGQTAVADNPDRPDLRAFVLRDRTANGDDVFHVSASDAPHAVQIDARDEQGRRLSTLAPADPAVNNGKRHVLLTDFKRDDRNSLLLIAGRLDRMYVSNMTSYRIAPTEYFFDTAALQYYTVRHDPLRDVSEPASFTKEASAYVKGRIEWPQRGAAASALSVCTMTWMRSGRSSFPYIASCQPIQSGDAIDYFTTPEGVSDQLYLGLSVSNGSGTLPLLRGLDGMMIASDDSEPGPRAFRMRSGARTSTATGPVHPYRFLDALRGSASGAFAGPMGDMRFGELAGTYWTVFNPAGERVAGGTLPTSLKQAEVATPPGTRIIAAREGLDVAGHASRGDVEIALTTGVGDLAPPTLNSLRILDAAGETTDRVRAREAATLRFSAADYAGPLGALPKSEATKVSYRVHGTGEWKPLAVVIESTEIGDSRELGRVAAGDVCRADLSEATAIGNALIDLRFELEDVAGNRTVWTQSPAFMVGDVPVPPKRRAAR